MASSGFPVRGLVLANATVGSRANLSGAANFEDTWGDPGDESVDLVAVGSAITMTSANHQKTTRRRGRRAPRPRRGAARWLTGPR
jgi:hypothetical protein